MAKIIINLHGRQHVTSDSVEGTVDSLAAELAKALSDGSVITFCLSNGEILVLPPSALRNAVFWLSESRGNLRPQQPMRIVGGRPPTT